MRDGKVMTPPERNILEGVTRIAVFELCDKLVETGQATRSDATGPNPVLYKLIP